MHEPDQLSATQILQQIDDVDDTAAARLLSIVYDELKRLASSIMRHERPDHTLQPTALVHEAYFKLIDSDGQSFNNRSHFLAVAARAMRQVLVDHARRHQAAKRGGDWARVTLDEGVAPRGASDLELLAIDEAMTRLARKDERLARVVELRYFGGLTINETAAALEISHTTVEDDWSLAKAWLGRELSGDAAP